MADQTPIETAAEALVDHQWNMRSVLEGRLSAHNQHNYDYTCAICRPDLDDGYQRVARVALASLVRHRDDIARVIYKANADWDGDVDTLLDFDQYIADALLAYLTGEPS